jgi:dipeptidyl aminopeptidase/acylaminoacyl peptidase
MKPTLSSHPSVCFRAAAPGVGLALLAALFAGSAIAQTAPASAASGPHAQALSTLLSTLDKTRSPRQAEISPDGMTVAWLAALDKSGSRIHLTPLGGMTSEQVISIPMKEGAKRCEEEGLAWSPDSKQIAFFSDCATPGQAQIFLADVPLTQAGAPATPRELTALKGFVHALAWSPDGKQLSFLYVENATRPAGALAPMKPAVGVISASTMAEVQRVAVLKVAEARNAVIPHLSQVTPANLHVYEFSWSPDSKNLAYIAATPPGEDNWWVAQLYTQAVENGAPRSILQPKMQIAVPRWSPDGKQIALIGGLMSDQGATGGDIYLIAANGGTAKDITPGRKATPAWLHWIANNELGFTEGVDGEPRYSVLNTETGVEDASARVTFPDSIGDGRMELSLSFAKKGHAALIKTGFETPPEVWAGPLKHLTQLTHLNDGLQPDWGKSESVTWTNEGFRVQGWLLYPKNYDPQKKYPLIVYVHGGPAAEVMPRWPYAGYGAVPFSTLDYFVLMPNPRGSYGEGEAFTAANRKDFGYGDLRDILAGVDTVTKKLPIDPARVGLTGWSYGGFMTMFAVTQTHRFRAAVAGAGISDWKSYYGENSIDQWMIPYFGASVYNDPAVYAKSSAINFIKDAKTPMLIVVGDRDGECPAPQSFEMWHALVTMHVPVKLVVYADEGHGFRKTADRLNVLERAIGWFEEYMPAAENAVPAAGHP